MTTATLLPPAAATRRRRWLAGWSRAGKLGLAVMVFWAAVALIATMLPDSALGEMSDAGVFQGMSAQHWLGTDYLGRDMLVRIVAGTPYTIGVALVATLIACALGAALGLLAAVAGGWLDQALSRVLDTLISIPSKMLALVIIAGFGSSVPLLIAVATIVYTPGCYRIIRSLAVNINAMDYVMVARARGERRAWIMRREILPNIVGPLLADMGLRFVYALRLLASLSFLGLGVQPPMADWGSLVRENLGALPVGGVSVLAPALAIATLTIAVNLVIDNLPGHTDADRETH
jgi:peptide/nickel transport system permease protein